MQKTGNCPSIIINGHIIIIIIISVLVVRLHKITIAIFITMAVNSQDYVEDLILQYMQIIPFYRL